MTRAMMPRKEHLPRHLGQGPRDDELVLLLAKSHSPRIGAVRAADGPWRVCLN